MARNKNNVNIWEDAHVYVNDVLDLPASGDAPVPESWKEVGILNGEAGFDEQRKWDEAKEHGWGVGHVATSRKNFEMTRTFEALEDNDVTSELYEPGSTADDVVVPRPARKYILFETINQNGKVERRITREKADIWAPGSKRSESGVASKAFTADIFADGQKRLLIKQVAHGDPANEVQKISLPSGLTGGTWTASYGGQTTTPINHNATVAAVKSALTTLSTIGAGNVEVTGSAASGYTVTFVNDLAGTNITQLTASGADLVPAGTITVETVTEGG
ncbi:hypothetical protein GS966_20015 [Rhodococcus hoagii]|nr:hypothetical protein [Prescottella equi]NKS73135.1 hypothetical protein [Prescottella equi]NKZ92213.1 hypothetical protein [Prescottella equi]